jgi:hypothetical protein
VSRIRLIVFLVFLGAAMVTVGWVLEEEGYVSDLFLQLGSAVLLIAPLVYVERLITRQIDQVRGELEDLRRQAEEVAVPYERVRSDQPSGSQRTATMEGQIDRAREDARTGKHSPEDVAALFASGSPGERIYALGLMQAKHSSRVSTRSSMGSRSRGLRLSSFTRSCWLGRFGDC